MSENVIKDDIQLRRVARDIALSTQLETSVTSIEVNGHHLLIGLPLHGSTVCILVCSAPSGNGFDVGLVGKSTVATRWIHDVLGYRLCFSSRVGREIALSDINVSAEAIVDEVARLANLVQRYRLQEERGDWDSSSTAPMYWSAGILNFGDWIGPHLVHGMTARQPVLQNRLGLEKRRVLWSVGSILGWFKRGNVDVWGSGLLRPLSSEEAEQKKKLHGVKIHAVRGKLTQKDVVDKIGWEVPDVYGDPGLLLPDIIPPSATRGHIAIVPHYIHYGHVKDAVANSGTLRVVDVRNDVRLCAKTISSASCVVSSSLHGLVVAQAYGVPWVRLRVTDKPLTGIDFKFDDFYSCLERDSVESHSSTVAELPKLDFGKIAEKGTLPGTTVNLDDLRAALPVPPATVPV